MKVGEHMENYDQILEIEKRHLANISSLLQQEIDKQSNQLQKQKDTLVGMRKEMWESGVQISEDPESMLEYNQYLTAEHIESSQYTHQSNQVKKYLKMQDKPYFARFDFKEEDEAPEPIYIGYGSLMDDDTYEVMIYDWRAPVASVFYRSELGKAVYHAPFGEVEGEVLLKRQYEIKKGQLEYFFDSSLTITDQILKDALGQNASMHMKNIVETIQKEQDQIIRNKTNDLLMVQGVAGSGKTSIAMHRIAYLLYEGMQDGLKSNQVMIISPNQIFGEYISTVLPELGEEHVATLTLEDVFNQQFKGNTMLKTRMNQLEYMMTSRHRDAIREEITFKGSLDFTRLLDELINTYEKKLIPFKDMYYNEELIISKDALLELFLDNPLKLSIIKRLNRIEHTLLEKIKPLEKLRAKELSKKMERNEIQSILDQDKSRYIEQLMTFTKVHYIKLYRGMLEDQTLLKTIQKGNTLPKWVGESFKRTSRRLERGVCTYEDAMVLLYMQLKVEDKIYYKGIKQVLIDESQDYYPIQYQIFKMLFKHANYTIIGDINQTIEKTEDASLYDMIEAILAPKNSLRLSLTKSYRSSYAINTFAKRLREDEDALIAYKREETPPQVIQVEDEQAMCKQIVDQIRVYQAEGFESVAILCKTMKEARVVNVILEKEMKTQLVTEDIVALEEGVLVMPIYMAKGLEYDAVILHDASRKQYDHQEDKQLLYIACTRALHRLSIFYKGEVSPFLVNS